MQNLKGEKRNDAKIGSVLHYSGAKIAQKKNIHMDKTKWSGLQVFVHVSRVTSSVHMKLHFNIVYFDSG